MHVRAVPAIVSLLALAAVSSAAGAQTRAPIQPKLGNWEVVQELSPEQAASIADMPPRVLERLGYDLAAKTRRTTFCLNAHTISLLEKEDRKLRETGKAKCADPVYSAVGDTMTMTLECTEPMALRMRTVYRFNRPRDAYEYESEVTAGSGADAVTRRTHAHARRIGDC